MSAIPVIYENGVFRPLEPVELAEGTIAQVDLSTPSAEDQSESAGERAYKLLMEIAALPHSTTADQQSDIGVRHDDILYPKNEQMP